MQQKKCQVGGLPVRAMEQLGQSSSREGRQHVWAMEGVVQTLGAPPHSRDWGRRKEAQMRLAGETINFMMASRQVVVRAPPAGRADQ